MAFEGPPYAQSQSPFFSLPPELRLIIYQHSLTTTLAFVNPVSSKFRTSPTGQTYRSPHYQPNTHCIPTSGVSLLATCQRLHIEVPLPSIFANNDLVFTSPHHITSFLSALPSRHNRHMKRITLSLATTSLIPPRSAVTPATSHLRDWRHFLHCRPHSAHPPGVWCSGQPTLASSLPWLEHLIIDLDGVSDNVPADMARLGIKTGLAKGVEEFVAGIGERFNSSNAWEEWEYEDVEGWSGKRTGGGRRLRRIELVGTGAHLWDVGDMMRPCMWGEWETVERWVTAVGERVLPHLADTVGFPRHSGCRHGNDLEKGMNGERKDRYQDRHGSGGTSKEESMDGGGWSGMLWKEKRFSLAAFDQPPPEKDVRALGYDHSISWAETVELTTRRQRRGHPVFALFV